MRQDDARVIKGVVLCADDFAAHAAVSSGIAALARLGRISAASAMVLSKRWAPDAALLKDLPQAIDVGLHLDWTSEFAMASGHGMPLAATMLRATLGGFGRGPAAGATRGVIARQLDAFEAHWKAAPDFVDGHQHVHQFAGIREALVQLLHERYGQRSGSRPYVRISRPPATLSDLKSQVIAAMGAKALEALASQAALGCSPALLGIYDFSGTQTAYGERMQGWLRAAPPGAIIMCHPAQTPVAGDAIGAARVREFGYLGSAAFALALEQAGVQVVRGRLPGH
jgi:predicted glycoside hydrolase/deacetylase ChbG (UPF0249 family)